MDSFNIITIPAIVNIVAGIANLYLFWKRGEGRITRDIIGLQEKQIQSLKSDSEMTRRHNHELSNQIQALTLKVGQLEGRNRSLEDLVGQALSTYFNEHPDLARRMQVKKKKKHG